VVVSRDFQVKCTANNNLLLRWLSLVSKRARLLKDTIRRMKVRVVVKLDAVSCEARHILGTVGRLWFESVPRTQQRYTLSRSNRRMSSASIAAHRQMVRGRLM
jgi:hypothetical protein